MTIQLTNEERDFIKTKLSELLPNATFYIFGSRAKGTAKQYSDLDLLILSNQPISLAILSQLDEAFVESNLPFKVDIVDWNRITPEFRDNIKREWISL